jgi:hypothetical protein
MKDLIEALNIFGRYGDHDHPTHCEHEVLYIVGITEDEVSKEDTKRLDQLGFHFGSPEGLDNCWYSHRFGSA